MCKLFKIFSFFITFLILIAVTNSSEAAKKNVAIMPIYTSSTTVQTNSEAIIYKLVAENMNSQLIIAFYNSDDYAVIERERVNQTLPQFGFQAGEEVEKDQAVKAGKKLAAYYSVIGKVNLAKVTDNKDKNTLQKINDRINQETDEENEATETEGNFGKTNVNKNANEGAFEGEISVELKFINNETGDIVFETELNSTQAGTNGANALRAACKAAAEDFLSQIAKQSEEEQQPQPEQQSPTEQQPQSEQQSSSDIMVIDVGVDTVYIDKGIESNLQKGDILNVIKTEPVKNMSGQIITFKTVILGKLEIQEVSEGYSICKIIEQIAPDSIQRGSIAKRASN